MRAGLQRLRAFAAPRLGTGLLVASWLWLFGGVLAWLAGLPLAHRNYRFGALVFGALAAVVASRLRRAAVLLPRAQLRPSAIALLVAAAGAYVLLDVLVQLHALSAVLLGLSAYALLGLHLPASAWRRGLAPALLLCAALPFGATSTNFLGLFARLATARVVESMLRALDVAALSSQTILVLENGIAHVDAPCSGLRSLWAGLLFVLAATWLLRRRPGLRWALVLCGSSALFLAANVARVLVLVLVGFALDLRGLAEAVHEPVGVLGFLLAGAGSYALLRHAVPQDAADEAPARPAPAALPYALAAVLAALSLAHALAPRPAADNPAPAPGPALAPAALPLTDAERRLFGRFDARADKWRVRAGGLTGSVLLVSTSTFRAQHPPELCLVAAGFALERSETLDLGGGVRVRFLGLRRAGVPATSVYFYESRRATTPDVFERLAVSLRHRERRWTMASLLLDGAVAPGDPALRALVASLHGDIAASLEGGTP